MRLGRLACLSLLLAGCQGEDAYLGSSHVAYRCEPPRCQVEQGAPENAGDWFFNSEARLGDAPEIVYPLSGSVHPEGLRELTVQFRRGRSDFSVFRVRFQQQDGPLAYDFFTPCLALPGDGCRYLLKGNTWDAARKDLLGKPLAIEVTGSTALDGVMKSSAQVPISITPSELENKGFYYWTSVPDYSGGQAALKTGIFRLPFGADHAEPFIMPESATNDRQCGACHSVSRDGSTIAFTARDDDDIGDQRSGVLVAAQTARPEDPFIVPPSGATYDSSMMALSGDGKRVLVAQAEQLILRDSSGDGGNGQQLVTLTTMDLGGKRGYFPEFSLNDDAVVLTLSSQPDSAIAVQNGDIAVMNVNLAANSFETPTVIVPGEIGEFHFYPTWSPDGRYIAFASAPIGQDAGAAFPNKSYDQQHARLRLVAREGGEVYELTNATHELDHWSTFPKFAPFEQGGLTFLTFNSKINYGLVLDNDSMVGGKIAQLWMAALDISKLPADPSSAPIWLPFQDATQSSHLGIWTKDVKCRTDIGGVPSCDIGQTCNTTTNTCEVIVK